ATESEDYACLHLADVRGTPQPVVRRLFRRRCREEERDAATDHRAGAVFVERRDRAGERTEDTHRRREPVRETARQLVAVAIAEGHIGRQCAAPGTAEPA